MKSSSLPHLFIALSCQRGRGGLGFGLFQDQAFQLIDIFRK
jgi:hypothetical protein